MNVDEMLGRCHYCAEPATLEFTWYRRTMLRRERKKITRHVCGAHVQRALEERHR